MKGVIVPREAATPGDVILFHRPTNWQTLRADPKGTLMTAAIHVATRSRYNHAAIYRGNGYLLEATDRGIVVSRLADKDDDITVIHPLDISNADRLEVLAYAMSKVGEHYGYLTAFMCGLNHILVGLNLVVRRGDEMICSEFVARAYVRAGADFGKSPALVAPGDLATFFGLPR